VYDGGEAGKGGAFTKERQLGRRGRIPRSGGVAKVRKGKKKGLGGLRKKADAIFSRYIRTRDGWKCTVCGRPSSVVPIDNGHYVKRGKLALRYNEINCNALCKPCNWRDNHYHNYYESAVRAKWGDDRVSEMIAHADDIIHNEREFLLDIITYYEGKK
jgi:hypothetical protein